MATPERRAAPPGDSCRGDCAALDIFEDLPAQVDAIMQSDVYLLRRVEPWSSPALSATRVRSCYCTGFTLNLV